jgi:hypothetical protein
MDKTDVSVVPPDLYKANPWPVSWSAIWIGALSAIAAITIFGLIGTALGAGSLQNIHDFSSWHEVTPLNLVGVVLSVFFAYVIGGWVAGKIDGAQVAEPAILHGAIAWLVTIPALVVLLALGAGKTFGGWYSGIASTLGSNSTALAVVNPIAVKHTALAAVTVLLLGLIGSVIGGWMSCGEPMSIMHHKTRPSSPRHTR